MTTPLAFALEEVSHRVYTERVPITQYEISKLKSDPSRLALKFQVLHPKEHEGKNVALLVNMAEGELAGPGLLYLNGQPFHGVDCYHEEILLTHSASVAEVLDLKLEAQRPRGYAMSFEQKPSLEVSSKSFLSTAVRVQEIWELAHCARFLKDMLEKLRPEDARREKIAQTLHEVLPWFLSDGSAERARQAQERLSEVLRELKPLPDACRALCFGHAHIDLAWLWPIRETIYRCGCTFATVLRLLNEYPEFVFVQSSAPFYLWFKEHCPHLWPELVRRVAEGRWEVSTAMWVESDTNLVGGEALIREFLWGKTFARETFGIEVDTLWLPDTFGFTAALPQLMKKSGIPHFATIKITWNDTNRFPHHTFWWEGLDGSRVLCHIPPSGDYNSRLHCGSLAVSEGNFCSHGRQTKVFAFPYGYGDGGGGPTASMIEDFRIYQTHLPTPRVEQKTLSKAFREIAAEASDLPCWAGDLYLELHRGTYTTQAAIKRANREAEKLYHDAELLGTLAYITGCPYPTEHLNAGWEKILRNHFHDILPGSSISEVYDQARKDYEEIRDIGEKVLVHATDYLGEKIETYNKGTPLVVWNTLPWQRTAPVLWETSEDMQVIDHSGRKVETQRTEHNGRRALLFLAVAPSMGYSVYYLRKGRADGGEGLSVSLRHIENRFFRLCLTENAHISSIFDKRYEREVLAGPANVWQIFDDRPAVWDAWDIAPGYENSGRDIAALDSVEVLEHGPIQAVLRIRRPVGERSRATQDIIVWNDIPRIEFACEVDWQEHRKLLKVSFPVAVHGRDVLAETQFGHIRHPTHRNTSYEQARFEFPAHKWIDLSESDYGVSLLNDSKYGHDVFRHRMRLTLLRSPKQPDPQADMGLHRFSYALWPHRGTAITGGSIEAAYEFNFPMLAFATGVHHGEWPEEMGFFTTTSGAILETVKCAHRDSRVIFRVYEAYGGSRRAVLKSRFPLRNLTECDLLERPSGKNMDETDEIRFDLAPFEIKTFGVEIGR